jgi:hypothetical protein
MLDAISKPQPHADAAATTLRQALAAPHAQLRDAIAATASAVTKLRAQPDIVLLMSAVDSLSLCAKALAKAAAEMHESADAALVASMESTGCTAFATAFHTTRLREGIASVDILDSSAVPAAFLVEREPIPDKRAIAKALKNGDADRINWAVLRAGKPHIQRKPNS